MIISRVLPTLIRLNHMTKCSTFTKTSSRNSFKLLTQVKLNNFYIRNMATDIDKEMNNPNRHFDYQQLIKKKNEENAIVIDVREHSEIKETGKIPGSIHIPLNDLATSLTQMSGIEFTKLHNIQKPKKDEEIIFTCRSGRRSLTAMKMALESGYEKAGNYKGGWLDWAEKTANAN